MAKIMIEVTPPRYVEIDPDLEDICPECYGVGEVDEMHVFIGPAPKMVCFVCHGKGRVEKKPPEPPKPKHDCEMAPGGSPCDNPGEVEHDGHWLCKGHMDNLIREKKNTLANEMKQLRVMKKQRREAGM